MKKSPLTVLASLAFCVATSLAADPLTEAKAQLHAFNDRFNALAAAYDVEGLVALYAGDSLWIAPKVRPVPGPAGAAETFGFLKSQQGSNVHSIDRLDVSADGTLAVMTGTAHILVPKAGLDFTGTYQFVLRYTGTEWEIVSDMYNMHEATAD